VANRADDGAAGDVRPAADGAVAQHRVGSAEAARRRRHRRPRVGDAADAAGSPDAVLRGRAGIRARSISTEREASAERLSRRRSAKASRSVELEMSAQAGCSAKAFARRTTRNGCHSWWKASAYSDFGLSAG